MTKHERVFDLVKERILHGDYFYKEVPTERELAVETGVSRMTARRALQLLVGNDLLIQTSGGRLEVRRGPAGDKALLRIALLSPSHQSGPRDRWRIRLDRATAARGWKLRPLTYMHWDDAVIGDALNGFDGVFLHPSTAPIPDHVHQKLAAAPVGVVALDDDLTHLGLPSIGSPQPEVVHHLLDHLAGNGAKRIACLNVQPWGAIIEGRINQWRIWKTAHGQTGSLIDEQIEPYDEPMPHAYEVMKRRLEAGDFEDDAVLCTTLAAARGCIRAIYETDLRIGIDIKVCSVDAEGKAAALNVPSITSLQVPDSSPFVEMCLDWMASNGAPWEGPLLMVPQRISVEARESSGPGLKNQIPVFIGDE